MTLPTTTILPLHTGRIAEGGAPLETYVTELVFSLQRQYEDVAQAVNGDVRRDVDAGSQQWTPVLKDTLDADTIFTYTADHQTGIVLRKGLQVDVWFDLKWTGVASGTTAGKMYIEAPYLVAVSAHIPFAGVVQTSSIAYTAGAYCTLNARPDTRQIEIWNSGTGVGTVRQGSVSSGQLIGHIRYVGQQTERS